MWKFIKSATDQNNWLEHDQNEIVFWGRSNVGKSSLINALASQKIAKTSSTPGRTRLINYFETQRKKIIVDLPGYGFASMSKKAQSKISGIIDFYFRNSKNSKNICILIDAKIGFSYIDLEMIDYLKSLGLLFDIIITKIDKANQSQKHRVKQQALTFSDDINIFMVSSEKKQGLSDLVEHFEL
ncbi:ribosome biogenesis GTP-binding protein YsxC [Metamycoplasma arthritidis]|uniref:Probable GTP-binding protein EngB n=1 Tax=Metamycoplasma arthritidis (strain 158L3-1) TaxID=243272 RepID=ENGB_META1|nr:ribosome biogenesis GTP-binding protein YihA/YsxC [Metamycoplasma arthritidis]B3PN57.1 RecName: Full=Probable GTP-binding protein EngB [Metamycoplasma arthritidis 158L3-1]ACF07459.1 GTPase protein YihA (EngB) [Metamycoplasma arthritidis 158L3-1]VEU78980.1 ribosome biogenesis GTP-binding protein YsxC [Metamycoplasma arthritidis]